jgi:hypothetical protein
MYPDVIQLDVVKLITKKIIFYTCKDFFNLHIWLIDGLIDYWLTFSEQYGSYIQDKNKSNNI